MKIIQIPFCKGVETYVRDYYTDGLKLTYNKDKAYLFTNDHLTEFLEFFKIDTSKIVVLEK